MVCSRKWVWETYIERNTVWERFICTKSTTKTIQLMIKTLPPRNKQYNFLLRCCTLHTNTKSFYSRNTNLQTHYIYHITLYTQSSNVLHNNSSFSQSPAQSGFQSYSPSLSLPLHSASRNKHKQPQKNSLNNQAP